jgi:prevent-host-death family protein
MVTITIRELRQAWPRAEMLLRATGEITITRDGRPVARLVRVKEARRPRKRFDAARHLAWQSRLARGRTVRWVDEFLVKDRDGI